MVVPKRVAWLDFFLLARLDVSVLSTKALLQPPPSAAMTPYYLHDEDIPPPVPACRETPPLIAWTGRHITVPEMRGVDGSNKQSIFRRRINRFIKAPRAAWLYVPILGKGVWEAFGIVIALNTSEEERDKAKNQEIVAEYQAILGVSTPAAWYPVSEP
ncbi:hypothetical protein BKA70DRAFT_1426375 [Coprinopsis sp. MPI-PUGE-AT-0042]|nr:hypothetical protein BKA70DRAFT_1426375 [Coprinopsis sp. MPI-PUGE-AT-0042]